MSKAFTRESDDEQEEGISLQPRVPVGTINYITPEGAERLKHQLDALLEKKQELTAEAEAERKKLEPSIRQLQQTLASVVVHAPPADRDKVSFGTSVTLRYDDGEEETFRIVGVEEAEPENGSISWLSPLARALLSRRSGDKVHLRLPGRERVVEIVAVL